MSDYSMETAREELALVAETFRAEGKQLKAAGLKARLQQQSEGRFNEAALGFATFGEFLRAAAADMSDYTLRGSGPHLRLATDHEVVQIRQDLWIAFTNWAQFCWVGGNDGEAVEASTVSDGAETIEIPRATPDGYLKLAQEFADTVLQGSARHALSGVVLNTSAADVGPLSTYLRDQHKVEWQIFRSKAVLHQISYWMDEHDLSAPVLAEEVRSDSDRKSGTSLDSLRRRIHSAIDLMSEEELNELRFPPSALGL